MEQAGGGVRGACGAPGPVLHRNAQAVEGGLENAAGLVISGRTRFAAAAPAFRALLAGDHTHQQRNLLGQEDAADLERPEAWPGGLQVAPGGLEEFLVEVVAEVAVIGQQRVGQGNPAGGRRHQRQGAGLLQARRHQGATQATLGLLLGLKAARGDRIGQMGGEAVVAHQAGHLFDQIHRPVQIKSPGWRHGHQPTLLIGREAATEGGEGGLDLAVLQVAGLAIDQHRTKKVVEGIPIEAQRRPRRGGVLVQPAAHHPGIGKLLQQGHGPVCGPQGSVSR